MLLLDPPVAGGSMAPNLLPTDRGLALTWLEPAASAPGTLALRFSRLEGPPGLRRWTPPRTVVSGGDFFANWADFPSAARATDGALLAHWLQRSGAGTYSYDVELARSIDGGDSWTRLGPVHDDGTLAEHGFVSMVAEAGGFRVFWLDGRETAVPTNAGDGGHGRGTDGDEAAGGKGTGEQAGARGAMTLRTAWVGSTLGSGELLDERVCECCQTSAGMTAEGAVVVYRDRSPDETRDISIVRRTSEGWSAPRAVHQDGWRVPGCPVNGPFLSIHPVDRERLAVAWFTAPENEPRVLVAFSGDGGRSFGDPVRVDGGAPLGRAAVLIDDAGDALVAWLEAGGAPDDDATIFLRRVRESTGAPAQLGEPVAFATVSASRASGFPRLARLGDDLLIAWTEGSELTRVRTGGLPLQALPAPTTADGAARGAAAHGSAPPWNRTIGSSAPDYRAATLDGQQVSLATLRGRPVLLNIWATWCVPCRSEVADLADIHARFGGRGLEVIGVSVDEATNRSRVIEFISVAHVPYRILLDPDDRASRVFGLRSLPATFLFDPGGVLIWSRQGVVHRNDTELVAILEDLAAPAPAR